MEILLIALCALTAGGVVWLFRGQRIAVLFTETLALRSQLAELRQRAERESAELVDARKRIFDLSRDAAVLRTNLESTAQSHDDQVRQLTALRQEFQDQFKVLAGDVLRTSNEDFAKRADEIFKAQKDLTAAEIDKRTRTIEDLLTPIGKSLEAYDTAIKDIEKSRIEGFAGIHQALLSVNSQHAEVKTVTAGLVNALRASPKTRGR
ncbi:MAG TPA: DNA recombination protein RmuC, partial [Rhizomicrobium sp.]|nr:DNA recombination protein RmuC [Rhizomicrobium sp.]